MSIHPGRKETPNAGLTGEVGGTNLNRFAERGPAVTTKKGNARLTAIQVDQGVVVASAMKKGMPPSAIPDVTAHGAECFQIGDFSLKNSGLSQPTALLNHHN